MYVGLALQTLAYPLPTVGVGTELIGPLHDEPKRPPTPSQEVGGAFITGVPTRPMRTWANASAPKLSPAVVGPIIVNPVGTDGDPPPLSGAAAATSYASEVAALA